MMVFLSFQFITHGEEFIYTVNDALLLGKWRNRYKCVLKDIGVYIWKSTTDFLRIQFLIHPIEEHT